MESISRDKTGFYFTLCRDATVLLNFRFRTANDSPQGDPQTLTIEGSSKPTFALILSTSWTLIYNGSTGLEANLSRFQYGSYQNLPNNTVSYKSYRFLIT